MKTEKRGLVSRKRFLTFQLLDHGTYSGSRPSLGRIFLSGAWVYSSWVGLSLVEASEPSYAPDAKSLDHMHHCILPTPISLKTKQSLAVAEFFSIVRPRPENPRNLRPLPAHRTTPHSTSHKLPKSSRTHLGTSCRALHHQHSQPRPHPKCKEPKKADAHPQSPALRGTTRRHTEIELHCR